MTQSYCSCYFEPDRERTLKKKKNEGSPSVGEMVFTRECSILRSKSNVEVMIDSSFIRMAWIYFPLPDLKKLQVQEKHLQINLYLRSRLMASGVWMKKEVNGYCSTSRLFIWVSINKETVISPDTGNLLWKAPSEDKASHPAQALKVFYLRLHGCPYMFLEKRWFPRSLYSAILTTLYG